MSTASTTPDAAPEISITIESGDEPLTYRLCSVCKTLRVHIVRTFPTICGDCQSFLVAGNTR